jgi:hypothetical protein
LTEATPAATGRLVAEFGPALTFKVVQPTAYEDACPISGCLPAKGGIGILSYQEGNPCTTGFVVKVSSPSPAYYAVLTAGHCFRVGGLGEGDDWRHVLSDSSTKIGDAQKQTWYNGADADAGLIKLTMVPADHNNIVVNTSGAVRSVTSIATSSQQKVGDFICRMGRASLLDCGSITDLDETKLSTIDGVGSRTIDHQNVVNFDSAGGDSGGPYYSMVGSTEAKAYGIHIHSGTPSESTGWFSTVGWSAIEYATRWNVVFSLCLSNSC